MTINLHSKETKYIFAVPFKNGLTTVRGGAEVARWAHNPKVVGSNPAPATKIKIQQKPCIQGFCYFRAGLHLNCLKAKSILNSFKLCQTLLQ